MPTHSSIIEITDHAVDRYEESAVAGTYRHCDAARNEIRELVRTGTQTAAPSWLPTVAPPVGDTRRYLVFGHDRALVIRTQTGVDGQEAIVVLTVITRPRVEINRGSL